MQTGQKTSGYKCHKTHALSSLHLQQSEFIQHRDGHWEPARVTEVGPEPRSYRCTTSKGTTFHRNRGHIQPTRLPDEKPIIKSAMKYTTASMKKKSTWSDEVHITLDAEAAYYTATQHAEETIPVSLAIPAEPLAVPNAEQADTAASTKVTRGVHNDYSDAFTGIAYFLHIFSLKIKII